MAAAADFLQTTEDTDNLTTYTFSSVNFGAADAGRYIVAAAAGRTGSSGVTVSSITIGGVSATIVVQDNNNSGGDNVVALAAAAVPSGTSGDVVVTFSTGMVRALVGLYRVTGIDGVDDFQALSSTAAPPSVALDIPANGIAIALAASRPGNASLTGVTADSDGTPEAQMRYIMGHDEFATTQTDLTVEATNLDGAAPVGVFASWSPVAAAAAVPAQRRMPRGLERGVLRGAA